MIQLVGFGFTMAGFMNIVAIKKLQIHSSFVVHVVFGYLAIVLMSLQVTMVCEAGVFGVHVPHTLPHAMLCSSCLGGSSFARGSVTAKWCTSSTHRWGPLCML